MAELPLGLLATSSAAASAASVGSTATSAATLRQNMNVLVEQLTLRMNHILCDAPEVAVR